MGASTGSRRQVTVDPAQIDDSECTILHADMDAFFAAVELRRRPELASLPMMVGSTGGRGVVLSATYEARKYGVRSAMPVSRAIALCPRIEIVEPDLNAYRAASREVMRLFEDVTPSVEPLSIDEAFLDVSGLRRIAGRPGAVAQQLRERIASELRLTCTIGAASSKFLAKLASGLAKPDGLLIIPPAQGVGVLHPLGVEYLWGVGPKTAQSLRRVGIATIGELGAMDRATLASVVGTTAADRLHALAWARDDRKVRPRDAESSMSADETFAEDTLNRAELITELFRLADKLARRLRSAGQLARTVAIRLRYSDFTTVTRSVTLDEPTDLARTIHRAAVAQLARLNPTRPARLIGIRLEQLADAADVSGQLAFGDPATSGWRAAETVSDAIGARFGVGSMRPASLLRSVASPVEASAGQPPRHGGRNPDRKPATPHPE